jgi:hypothetical protein
LGATHNLKAGEKLSIPAAILYLSPSFVCVVVGFELRAYNFSNSTSPIFAKVFL